jgi:Spy/CpxP family protein refolding chaperone
MKTSTKQQKNIFGRNFHLTGIGLGLLTFVGVSLGCTEASGDERANIFERSDPLNNEARPFNEYRRGDCPYGQENGRPGRGGGKGMHRRGGPGRGMHGKGGSPMMLLRTSLNLSSLTSEQQAAIEALKTERWQNRRPGSAKFDVDFRATIIKALRDGAIDPSDIAAHQEKMDAARESHMEGQNKMLLALHDTLDATQRQEVADIIKTRMANRSVDDTRRGRRGGRRGQFMTDDGADDTAPGYGPGRRHNRGRHVFWMLKDLDLTEEQQAAVNDIYQMQSSKRPTDADRAEKREEMKQCREAFLDAFVSEQFDPNAARCPRFTEAQRAAKRERRTGSFAKLLTILNETQRLTLADRLEKMPQGRPF